MFVRFRRQRRRLNVSLIATRRAEKDKRKIITGHVGALGSVDVAVSVRERLAFWAKLPQRLEALGNRVAADQHLKIYDAVHARIPTVTSAELRAIQEENAKDDERFWNMMQEMNASSAEGHKLLIASAEAKRKEHERCAAEAAERREVARERLAKLARGETVAGGFGKPVDLEKMLLDAGVTKDDLRHWRDVYEASEAFGFEQVLQASSEARDRAERRIARNMAKMAPLVGKKS
jgi:hypothetical protein